MSGVDYGDFGPGAPGGPAGKKPERSGFRIFLYVLLGLGVLGIVTCGAATFYAYRNPALRAVWDAAIESQSAAGTEELRSAGCAQAAAMDLSATMDAIAEIGDTELGDIGDLTFYVTCQLSAGGATLDCDEVSRIYLAAVSDPPERFVVQVGTGVSGSPACQDVYAGDGTRLGSLDDFVEALPKPSP